MKKKILYIHHGWGIGGAPISLLNLIINLNSNKFEIIVLCTHNSEAVNLFKEKGIHTIVYTRNNSYFRHHEKGKLKLWEMHKIAKIIFDWIIIAFFSGPKIIKNIKPDLVHLNSEVILNWAFASKKMNIPVICHNRDPIAKGYFGLRKSLIKKIVNKYVDKIISISDDNASRLATNNISIVYNPIPQKFLEDYNKLNKYSSKRVLFLGGFHRAKGIELLLDSIEYLEKGIDIYIAGYLPRPTMKNKLIHRSYFRKLRNYPNVILLGVIEAEQVLDELKRASILIFPAIKPHFPRPIIEAFATQTAVMATNVQGMDEVVFNNINGYLVSINAKEIAEKLNQAINDPLALEHFGKNGNAFAMEKFNPSFSTSKILEIYSEYI